MLEILPSLIVKIPSTASLLYILKHLYHFFDINQKSINRSISSLDLLINDLETNKSTISLGRYHQDQIDYLFEIEAISSLNEGSSEYAILNANDGQLEKNHLIAQYYQLRSAYHFEQNALGFTRILAGGFSLYCFHDIVQGPSPLTTFSLLGPAVALLSSNTEYLLEPSDSTKMFLPSYLYAKNTATHREARTAQRTNLQPNL